MSLLVRSGSTFAVVVVEAAIVLVIVLVFVLVLRAGVVDFEAEVGVKIVVRGKRTFSPMNSCLILLLGG